MADDPYPGWMSGLDETMPGPVPLLEGGPVLSAYQPSVIDKYRDPNEIRAAGREGAFDVQPNRHAAYARWQALPPEERKAVFEDATDRALTQEGIVDPVARQRWKAAMGAVVVGDRQTHGENPDLNPFAQAYDLPDQPGYGVNPRTKDDRTASSARGYFQFIAQPNKGQQYSTWDLVRLPSKPGEDTLAPEDVFDPVANARGFIRATNRASNYQGDPWKVWADKQAHQSWSPQLRAPN